MAEFVANASLEEIQRRIPIVDLVSTYVRLKKQGHRYVGLCPFHTEKTPSFSVSPDKGLFYCFGCGAGGTIFTFLMRIEGVDFRTAVERLAEQAGVPLETRRGAATSQSVRERAHTVHRLAAEFFAAALARPEGSIARAYLEHRGISRASAEKFGVGFCPAGPALQRALAQAGVSAGEACRWGLLTERGGGGLYPRFAGRLIFPIRNASGSVVAFAGRAMGDQVPKYVNSPESAVFRKGELLFGLYEARNAIRETGRVVVVEGYLDVLSLVQAGIGEVVATMGTAVTEKQLEALRRLAEEVVVCFDGDEAGRRAAERAFTIAAKVGVWAHGVFLPAGEDPDSFVRAAGSEAMREAIAAAVPLADFYLERKAPPPGATLAAKARAVHEVSPVVASVPDPVMAQLLIRKAAARIGVDEHMFQLDRSAPTARLVSSPRGETATARVPPEEQTLLAAMAANRQVTQRVAAEGGATLFVTPAARDLARDIEQAWETATDPAMILPRLPQEIEAMVSAYLLGGGPLAGADLIQIANDCVGKLRKRQNRTRLEILKNELRVAERQGDAAKVAELRDRLKSLRELLGP